MGACGLESGDAVPAAIPVRKMTISVNGSGWHESTRRDMAKFAHRHSDGIDQFNAVMGAMRSAPDLVELGKDGRGEDGFTTRDMIETERRLHHAAKLMAERECHEVNDADRQAALARAEQRGLVLSA